MEDIKISVVIPVYKVEDFLRETIESVLIQPEVYELVLLEDASPDKSIDVCREYAEKYPDKVKVFQHPDKKNHGAAESMSAGIRNSTGNYIAILGADDLFLPDRFKITVEMLRNNPEIDGTHGMLDVFYENEEVKAKFGKRYEKPTGISEEVEPEKLFETLLKKQEEWVHLNTLTFKKSLIEKTGYLDEKLRISQDMHFLLKLALCAKLKAEPRDRMVATRRVHSGNRITCKKNFYKYHKMLIPSFLEWANENNKDIEKYLPELINRHLGYLRGYSCVFSDKKTPLRQALYIKELLLAPFYIKRYIYNYSYEECMAFLVKAD